MEKLLDELVQRLRKAFGDRLVSVILYGSAAVGDHSGNYSDINIFCVLSEITPRELDDAGAILNWWRRKDNPSPLMMSVEEVRTSTDCFPIEFHDIQMRHRVLFGEDVVDGLEIDESFYRAQVEYQLRSKLLRLRQKSAGVMHQRELLLRLMGESVSTFCVLTRHALRLHGVAAEPAKRAVVAKAAERFGVVPDVFLSLLDLRDGKIKAKALDPAAIFGEYLREIHKVIDAVDKLEK